jgi:plasmid stability protein
MPNVLIRDLDENLLERLKKAAAENGRSLQAEMHAALERAALRSMAHTRRISEKWLRELGDRAHSDSAELVREDRDSRSR